MHHWLKKFQIAIIEEDIKNIDLLIKNIPQFQTLDDMKDLDLSMRQMKSAWRVGNMQTLQQEALASWEQQFPELFDSILTQRNNNWIPKLEAMLSTKYIELVLVGALHLVGKHGVLSQLKARGYSIKQLN